jgi:hypothetical protein
VVLVVMVVVVVVVVIVVAVTIVYDCNERYFTKLTLISCVLLLCVMQTPWWSVTCLRRCRKRLILKASLTREAENSNLVGV